jgi:multidrug efflux pump subunit AcrA (membrane-fusion protein)
MELNLTKKRLYVGAAVAVFVLLVLWMIFSTSPVNVETATAVRGEMLVTVDGEGKTRLKDKITVTAPVSGKMSRIKLREGDLIAKEFVITEIDPNPPAPRPPSETENRINPYALKVYAPISGRILRVLEKNERILPAGTPLVEIGNPATAEIVVDVLSTEAAAVHAGAQVLIQSETSAELIKGRVRTVEPQAFTKVSALGVEEQRVNIIADFLSKNTNFGDNFRVDARIIVWQSENVLKIPSSALFRGSGEKWSVFVVESGKVKRREVSVGHQTSAESEILEGLSENEIIVLHPPNQLADGTSVKIQ